MTHRRSNNGALGLMLFLAFVAAGWWFLGPTALGGKTSYAVTSGVSMEPHFHAGDLVILRRQGSYHVGEVVGYHSHQLHRNVMHRIVRIVGNRYYFKGDNNSYVDPEHPTADQLFGREWLRVPGFGSKLETLHKPRNAAILSGVVALFVLAGGGATTRRRRRRRMPPVPATPSAPHAAVALQTPRPVSGPPRPAAVAPSSTRASYLPQLALTTAAIGLAAVAAFSVLGAMAYSHPPQRVVTQTNLYTQRGVFSYSAPVPIGAVYDHSPLTTGDAVFFALVHGIDVGFSYSITSKEHASFGGQAKLDAILTDGNGWKRTLSLAPLQTFTGGKVDLRGYLNLDSLRALTKKFEARTGALPGQYHLVLHPVVHADGAVEQNFVHEQFTPTLQLDMTNDRLRITQAPGVPTGFARTQSGTGTTRTPSKLGGLSLGVSEARGVAKVGIPIAILLSLLGGALFLLARSNDEVADIRRRYGPWMIDVAAADRPPHLERRVESMEALARIAERYERLILHEQRDRMHTYLVEDDGVVYRYDAHEKHTWRGAPPAPEPVAAQAPGREPGGEA